jgi:hypothetical protein
VSYGDDDWGMPEPFGPIYERPAGDPCPDCTCCTARLCEAGRKVVGGCKSAAPTADREIVRGCPCGRAPGTTHDQWEQQQREARIQRGIETGETP